MYVGCGVISITKMMSRKQKDLGQIDESLPSLCRFYIYFIKDLPTYLPKLRRDSTVNTTNRQLEIFFYREFIKIPEKGEGKLRNRRQFDIDEVLNLKSLYCAELKSVPDIELYHYYVK